MKNFRNASLLFVTILFASFPVFSQARNFLDVLRESGIRCDIDRIRQDAVRKAVLYEYGAVLVSRDSVLPRSRSCEISELAPGPEYRREVDAFADGFRTGENRFSFGEFFLQRNAKKSLEKVFARYPNGFLSVARNCNVEKGGISISEWRRKCTAYGNLALNNDWALRTYEQTILNWNEADTDRTRLKATDGQQAKPKMYSYAIPGTSQHHFGLAIDVNNGTNVLGRSINCDAACVARLEANGWFRTVRYDKYHFTYLGYKDPDKLMEKGLKQVVCNDNVVYWVPNIPGYNGIGRWVCQDL